VESASCHSGVNAASQAFVRLLSLNRFARWRCGRVHGHEAEAIGGAKVSVEAGGKPAYQATTDDQGVFRIQPVKLGTYTASFSKPEFLPSAQEGFNVGSNSIHLRGVLTPRNRVAGRVLDASGRPVSGAELLLDGSLKGQTASSDDQGNFLFRANPGSYILSARAPMATPPPAAAEDDRLGWGHTYYPSVLDRSTAVKISVHAGADVWGQDITLRGHPFLSRSWDRL
jgi:hypothetical protein